MTLRSGDGLPLAVGAGDRLAGERLAADLIDLGVARHREAFDGHVVAEDLAVEVDRAGAVEARTGVSLRSRGG